MLDIPAGNGAVKYDCTRDRWSQDELWGSPEIAIIPPLKGEFSLPVDQIRAAEGGMRTDVGWRDRRLVLQSGSLAIVCPKDPTKDRITRGVNDEIATATAVGIPCFYWQKPEWDPKNYVETQFPAAGSMGAGHVQMLVNRADSLAALVAAKI